MAPWLPDPCTERFNDIGDALLIEFTNSSIKSGEYWSQSEGMAVGNLIILLFSDLTDAFYIEIATSLPSFVTVGSIGKGTAAV